MNHDELQNNSSDTGTKVPMTHDELMAKIKNNGTLETELVCTCPHKEIVEIETRPHRNDKALRAVVELHKPDSDNNCECQHDYLEAYGSVKNLYPCETIQHIIENLK